jgi:hypothetical protein
MFSCRSIDYLGPCHGHHLIHRSAAHPGEEFCESVANVPTPDKVNTGIVADLNSLVGILVLDLS